MTRAGSNRSVSDSFGRTFGPYEFVRRLGVGGMAETFEAIRRGPGGFTQRVCLKLVLPFFRDKQSFLELFEREARLAAKLRHSNIVGVIDFGRIDGVTYMALELVDGIDLATLLEAQPGGRLSPEHVALLGTELARALEHAHDPRRDGAAVGPADNTTIIHRDLSPSNVMISQRGEVLLTDFGVAKALTGAAHQPSAVKGKVPYMSPEQLRAEHLDPRSDLFSLGVVLFEALAGERPFQGEHDPATIMMVLKGDHPSLRSLAPAAPAGLCEVIESLLDVDPNRRPQSASAVLDLLDPLVTSPLTRREVGALVMETRAAQEACSSEPPASDEDGTKHLSQRRGETSDVSPVGAPLGSEDTESKVTAEPRGESRKLFAWTLSLLALISAAIALWSFASSDTAIRQDDVELLAPGPENPSTDRIAVEKAPGETAEPNDTGETNDTHETKPAPEPTDQVLDPIEPARLSIIVFPWGDVWVDGKRRGAAPVKDIALRPGRHKISAGQGRPTKTQTVRLREGDRKTLQFDLTQ